MQRQLNLQDRTCRGFRPKYQLDTPSRTRPGTPPDAGGNTRVPRGTLLPPNSVQVYRCSPGQRVSAISNDAGTFSLSITELTD
jgi:hypothetical protein